MEDFNLALLYKWKWRIIVQSKSVWHGVLRAIYRDIKLSVAHGGGKVMWEHKKSQWWRDIMALEGAKLLGFFNSN